MNIEQTLHTVAAIQARIARMSPFLQLHTDWLASAAQLPGRTLNYAMAMIVTATRQNTPYITPNNYWLKRYGFSRDTAGEALTRLEQAGLVSAFRMQGRRPRITLLDRSGNPLQLRKD